MPNPHAAINPRFIRILTGQDMEDIGDKPTLSMLPGSYARIVDKQKSRITPANKPNKHYLKCGHCGCKGKYDVGMVLFNADRWFEDDKKRERSEAGAEKTFADYLQYTAYIRCKHCNGAGKWEQTDPFLGFAVLGGLLMEKSADQSGFANGEFRLYDGYRPRWASDGEERFLDRLQEAPSDGYLWNRLGNLYWKSGRPELAASAFEQSLRVDPGQMESHFSLGDMLLQIGEWEQAAYHLRMMLVAASGYEKLDAYKMREMLAAGLQRLLDIHMESNKSIAFLPTEDELAILGGMRESAATAETHELALLELDLHPDEHASFLPLAEMYMRHRRDELPAHERTLDKHLYGGKGRSSNEKGELGGMFSLGSEQRPIIVKVKSEEKGQKIARICEQFGWKYILGFEYSEDVTDLKKALKEKMSPGDVYAPCPCGSGKKYKFCCAKLMKNFDVNRFIADFKAN